MARVELDRIGKRYPNGFEAIESCSIDIADGEFIVLVGPSGCGKSTMLRMVAGLEAITSGELRIDGRRVNELAPKARDVAMVFQSYALYPHMTVFDNMAFALKLAKVPRAEIEQRIRAVAEQLDITELLPRKPKMMSGGQRQRVAIGRAIVRAPKVFLFDEPLSNLDAKLRLQMRVEISRLHRRLKATTLYVTHDQVEAMTLADRIVLLKDGEVQQIGPPMTLYHQPANQFVASFIGSPAMNLVDGVVRGDQVAGEGWSVAVPKGVSVQEGQAVCVGVRPEHMTLSDDGVEVVVEVVEPMGSESYVYCRQGEQSWVIRVAGDRGVQAGQSVRLSMDEEHLHFFDGASEARL